MANPYFVAAPLTVYDGDIAKASDLNNMGVSLETAFDLSDQILQTITTDTATLVALADADVALTHADVVLTHADVVLTHADVVLTHADVVLTHADAANTALDKAATNADVVLTHADVVLTHADVVLTHADVTSAAASALAAATSYDNFDDRYLGAKAADPTLDNDGNALLTGALYWNTVANEMRIYTGTVWVNPTATAIVGPVSAVDSQIVLFDSTSGKLAKAATTTGILKGTSGVIGAAVSGTDVKTINSTSVLGSGDIAVQPTLVSGTNIKTVGGDTILGSGNLKLAVPDALTHLLHPTLDGNFRDTYRAGALPSWFNQQWGGAQWGNLPDGSFGSVATGSIEDNQTGGLGASAGTYFVSEGFKVSESTTYNEVLVKLHKDGNPTSGTTARIYSDNAGSPGTALGTLVSITNESMITSKADGVWYRLTGFNVALTAGTLYHLVLSRSVVDGTNYLLWRYTSNSKYPHGFSNIGTSAPVWTQQVGITRCFIIVNPSANSLLQPGGMFGNYKLSFNNGSPIDQSRSLSQPLSQFYDGKECSVIHRGTYAASSNVWDFAYGLDHDRITVTVNASGYPVLSIYEADRTLAQVTGTSAITTGDHDVAIKVRTVGDGADYAYLYVDGVSVGTPLTAQTFTMSKEMRELGTARIGDGFGIIPAWTQDMQMTSLPSAQGWTWNGTATEANAVSIQNNKAYFNASGYASTDTGYYSKTTAFNNTTGWAYVEEIQVAADGNVPEAYTCQARIYDGSKFMLVHLTERFLQSVSTALDATVQVDLKAGKNILLLTGKGSDYYVFLNGKLVVDGTGKLTAATATNAIWFGDSSAGAGQNTDAIISSVKYYTGGIILPTANNRDCSEFAHWSGDKSALFAPLWNAGSPVSVKQLCGVEKNYVGEGVVQKEVRRGVTANPTTSSTTYIVDAELEGYVIGSHISSDTNDVCSSSGPTNAISMNIKVDGVESTNTGYTISINANYPIPILSRDDRSTHLGLHKVEGSIKVNGGTNTMRNAFRVLQMEAKS